MSDIFVGQMHPPGPGGADDLFKVESVGHRRAGRGLRGGHRLQGRLAVIGR